MRRRFSSTRLCAPLLVLALLLPALAALAVEPAEMLPDPKLEARARRIASELRCLVCQNQSIDDSDAALAKDLRMVLRERIKAGDSDADARSYIVSRYGDFVLLRPPFKLETLLLWTSPLLALGAGALAIYAAFRRSRRIAPAAAPALTAEEQESLRRLSEDGAD